MEDIAQQLDRHSLVGVVRQALNDDRAILDTWQVQRIDYPNVSPESRGLYRVSGTARVQAMTSAWSVVLKVYAAPADPTADDPSAVFYWQREALAYQSGLLTDLPGPLTAPKSFGMVAWPANRLWLWLEDIQPPGDDQWPLARYRLAARHFGMFGGAYLTERRIPDLPWLSRRLLHAWVAASTPLLEQAQRPSAWDHPVLRRAFPAQTVAAVLRLWAERETFLARLEGLPQTLCHHDVWRKNLFTRTGRDGQTETVAIDWELVGTGAAGEDVGNLLGVSLLNFEVEADHAPHLAEQMLGNYLAGLHTAGWHPDTRAVEYAFNTAAALRCAFSTSC